MCCVCVCDMDMHFTYIHVGWEGSANDSRMLDEVINDSKHGFPWPPTGIIIIIFYPLFVLVIFIVTNTTTFIVVRMLGHTTRWIRTSLLALVFFHRISQLGTMLKSSVQTIDNQQQRKSHTTIDIHRCGWLLSDHLEC